MPAQGKEWILFKVFQKNFVSSENGSLLSPKLPVLKTSGLTYFCLIQGKISTEPCLDFQ